MGLPIKYIILKFGDIDVLKQAMDNGDVNFIIDAAYKPGKYQVEYGFGNIAYYLIFKQNREIGKNEDFRQAVDHTLKRKIIKDIIAHSLGIDEVELLSNHHLYNLLSESPGQDISDANYDEVKAKKFWIKAKESLNANNINEPIFNIAPISNNDVYNDLIKNIIEQLSKVGIKAKNVGENKESADALISTVNFNTPEFLYLNLHSKSAMGIWGYNNPFMDSILNDDMDTTTFKEIQRVLSKEHIFIPLIRHGIAVTHINALDTKSRHRTTEPLFGPDVAIFEFKQPET